MSVQVELLLPSIVVSSPTTTPTTLLPTAAAATSPTGPTATTTARRILKASRSLPQRGPLLASSSTSDKTMLNDAARRPPAIQVPSVHHHHHRHHVHSPSLIAARRESLKLSFNRSISDPHGAQHPVVLSPPSLSPSLHPSKRCRVEAAAAAAAAAAESSVPATPVVPMISSPCLLRPPPTSIAPPLPPGPAGSVSLPASPCGDSSTLQRTLLLQNARTTGPDTLAGRLAESAGKRPHGHFLLVDCRPFIAYNVNHIRGAINVNCCDRFNRKRLQQGKATLADLATTKEGKELLKKRTWKEVVVYDDCSDSLESLPVSHTLFLVMNALVEDHREPVMLLGGLRDFQVGHRALCADHLMSNKPSASGPVPSSPAATLLPDLPSPSDICGTKDIENHPPTQVLPHLYLGNMRDAADADALKRQNIRHVLNVTARPPDYALSDGIVYKQLEAADNGVQNLRQFFEEAFDFIDLARSEGSGVLVHCHAGVSRSPTIAVAYLMKQYPMAMAEAYKFVKRRRSIISPNLNFMGQLWEFEQGLRWSDDNNDGVSAASASSYKKEPLTLEMQQIKESLNNNKASSTGSSPFLSSSSSPGSGSASSVSSDVSKGLAPQSFRWAEHQQPKEDSVTSGCSV